MARIKTFCPHCGSVVPAGQRCRCRPRPKRRPTKNDATRGEREPWRKGYASEAYQTARQTAIARTEGRCACCGRVCAWRDGAKWWTAGMGGEVHHVIALCDGGTHDAGNLELLCKRCHGKKDSQRRAMRKKA